MIKLDIAISPVTEALKEKIEELRKEFLRLYTQKDEMLSIERDDLYIRYIDVIGRDKYENFCLSIEVRALKMKCELAQAAINRDEHPDISFINRQVDKQLEDYYRQVAEQAEAIKAAEEAKTISSFDLEEMQQLFRLLVKRLHPDLHPDQSEAMKDLFIQGQTAYRTHNMQLLREIIMRLDLNEGIDEFVSKSQESLEQIIERLETQIAEIKSDINTLLTTFPFNIRKQIMDPAWVHQEQEELKRERRELEELKETYTKRLQLLIEM